MLPTRGLFTFHIKKPDWGSDSYGKHYTYLHLKRLILIFEGVKSLKLFFYRLCYVSFNFVNLYLVHKEFNRTIN